VQSLNYLLLKFHKYLSKEVNRDNSLELNNSLTVDINLKVQTLPKIYKLCYFLEIVI